MRKIAGRQPGTTAVVEFLLDEGECDELDVAFQRQARDVAERSGEPMISFYHPCEVERLLASCGFGTIELLDAEALGGRYLRSGVDLRLPGAAIFAVTRR